MTELSPHEDKHSDNPGFFIPDNDPEWDLLEAQNLAFAPLSDEDIAQTVQITLRRPELQRSPLTMNYPLKEHAAPQQHHHSHPRSTRTSPAVKMLIGLLVLTNAATLTFTVSGADSRDVNRSIHRVGKQFHASKLELEDKLAVAHKALQESRVRQEKLQQSFEQNMRELQRVKGLTEAKAKYEISAKLPNVSVQFQDADIRKVLPLIAENCGVNLIVSPDVTGRITVKLKDVPWRAAIEAIVKTVGSYVLVEDSNKLLRVVHSNEIQDNFKIAIIPLVGGNNFGFIEKIQGILDKTPNPDDSASHDEINEVLIIRASPSVVADIVEGAKESGVYDFSKNKALKAKPESKAPEKSPAKPKAKPEPK